MGRRDNEGAGVTGASREEAKDSLQYLGADDLDRCI